MLFSQLWTSTVQKYTGIIKKKLIVGALFETRTPSRANHQTRNVCTSSASVRAMHVREESAASGDVATRRRNASGTRETRGTLVRRSNVITSVIVHSPSDASTNQSAPLGISV